MDIEDYDKLFDALKEYFQFFNYREEDQAYDVISYALNSAYHEGLQFGYDQGYSDGADDYGQ